MGNESLFAYLPSVLSKKIYRKQSLAFEKNFLKKSFPILTKNFGFDWNQLTHDYFQTQKNKSSEHISWIEGFPQFLQSLNLDKASSFKIYDLAEFELNIRRCEYFTHFSQINQNKGEHSFYKINPSIQIITSDSKLNSFFPNMISLGANQTAPFQYIVFKTDRWGEIKYAETDLSFAIMLEDFSPKLFTNNDFMESDLLANFSLDISMKEIFSKLCHLDLILEA